MQRYRIYSVPGVLLLVAASVVAVSLIMESGQRSDEALAPYSSQRETPSVAEKTAMFFSPFTASFRNPLAATLECGLTLSVVPSKQTISIGDTITYRVLVENKGYKACESASFSVYYGENESVLSATPKSSSAGDYYWMVKSLAPGATLDVTITTRHIGVTSGEIKNEVCATANNALGDVCKETRTAVGSEPQGGPVVAASPISTPAQVSGAPLAPPGKEFGTWIWESPIEMDTEYAASLLAGLQSGGFNAVYITIDDYLPIASLPLGSDRAARARTYFARLSEFVSAANRLGVAVDVEGGWKDWAAPENRWKSYALINVVSEYNAAYPNAKVRGLQFDVEPYLLSTYERNKGPILTEFVSYVDDVVSRMQYVDARVSFVIPHFYDSAQKWTPAITYNGTTKYTFSHLLDILEKKKGSSIILMSYRDFFDGSNGTKQISEAEIRESADGNYATSVIVAQETGNVDPEYVTFYGNSRRDVLNASDTIQRTFQTYVQFGGVAIHYLDTFLELE